MQVIEPRMWHADVDYLRLTHRPGPGYDSAAFSYQTVAAEVAGRLMLEQYRPERWMWRGYYGETWGSVSWGEGAQGAILQVSGAAAAEAVRHRLPYTGTPRLDLQVTYWLGADVKGLAAYVAEQTDRVRYGPKGPKWAARLVDGRGDGDTCYIGRRGKRSKFLRVYDKWREQGQPDEYQYAWRFEAELTDEHAEYALGTLLDTELSQHTVLGVVAAYFRERGITLPEVTNGSYYRPSMVRKPPESMARTLRWLEEQVAPALEKAYGRGLTQDEVRAILGL